MNILRDDLSLTVLTLSDRSELVDRYWPELFYYNAGSTNDDEHRQPMRYNRRWVTFSVNMDQLPKFSSEDTQIIATSE